VRRLTPARLRALGAVCLLVALGSWSLASPVGSSPDEDYHLVSIWCSHGERAGLCEGLTAESARVPTPLLTDSCYAFHPAQSAACQLPMTTELVQTTRGNFAGGYPPVFYWVDGFFAGHDIGNAVVLIRIVNVVLFLAVFSAVYLLLPPGLRRAQVAGTLLTAVPLDMFLVPSLNPSSWAILSAATFLVSVLGYLTTEDRRRRLALGAMAALTLLIGAGARGDSAIYAVVAVAAALILTARASRTGLRRLIYPAVLAVIAGVAFLSVGQSASANPNNSTADHFSLGRLTRVALDVPALWIGGMGARVAKDSVDWGLGWLDTAMPAMVWVGGGCLYAAVLFYALTSAGRRRMLAAGLVGLAALLVPTYLLYVTDQYVGDFLQPRYVLPLLTMLAVTAMVRLDGAAFRLTRGHRWTVVTILAIANAVALYINIRRYVTGTDVLSWNLNRGIEWWWKIPISPMAVWVIGALAFGVGIAVLTAELTTSAKANGAAVDAPGAAAARGTAAEGPTRALTSADDPEPVTVIATAG
jgi:hypothetical protein